mgnify:FL=1
MLKRSKCSILLGLFKHVQELSAVKKVLETIVFLALGSFGTLGPKLSHGTSSKFADVRTHLRKVFQKTLSSIWRSWSKGQLPFFTLTSCLSRTILSLTRLGVEGLMKSYLVKWLIAIVLAVFFLWLSLETDLLPKEVYPLLLVPILIVGLYLFKER